MLKKAQRPPLAFLAALALAGCNPKQPDFDGCEAAKYAAVLARPDPGDGATISREDAARRAMFTRACMGSKGYDYMDEDAECARQRVLLQAPVTCFEARGITRALKQN